MKTTLKFNLLCIPLVLLTVFLGQLSAQTDGTYDTNVVNGTWDDTNNWVGGIIANGAGATATIDRTSFTSNRSVLLDADRTIGILEGVGVPSSSRSITVTGGSGNFVLTFDNGASPSVFRNLGVGNTSISADVELASDLHLQNSPNVGESRFMTLSGTVGAAGPGLRTISTIPSLDTPSNPNDHRIVISGSTGITDGAGQVALVHGSGNFLNLQGSDNTFSGGLTLNSGIARVTGGTGNRDAAIGAPGGAVTFNGGALAFISADVFVDSNRPTSVLAGGGTLSVTPSNALVTWGGVISGPGHMEFEIGNASGVLTVAGANVYEGGTTLSGNGTIETGSAGTFGTGDLFLSAGTTINFGNNFALDEGASFEFTDSSFVGLFFGGELTVSSLIMDALSIGEGVYNASQLNAFFGESVFSGAGQISVIPEPATVTFIVALLAAGLVAFRRRRNS